MRPSWEKFIALLGILFTLTWPMLLGGVIAGSTGVLYGALIYVVFGLLFFAVLLLGGIRGILGF